MRFSLVTPFVVLTIVAGCAGEERQCGTIPADELCDRLAGAYCGRKADCIGWLDYQRQACLDDILASCEPRMASVGRGMAVYDGEEAACIEQDVERAACTGISLAASGALPAIISGSVASGAACAADWECESDLFCSFTNQCPGHCTARARANESCSGVKPCLSTLVCVGETCKPHRKRGETCGHSGEAPCESGTFCKDGTCATLLRDGEPCETLIDCMSGQCLGNGTCGPARVVGETCQDFECGEGLYCAFDAERVCAPRAHAGTPCGYIDFLYARFLCEWRSFCEPTVEGGRCSAHLGEGAACDPHYSGNRCSPDLYCNGTQRKCLPLEPAGASCSAHEQCASYYCSNGICMGNRVCASPG